MIECALFGYLKENESLLKFLNDYKIYEINRIEKLYANNNAIIRIVESNGKKELIKNEMPDKNKNRIVLCSNFCRSEIKTFETLDLFLESFAYKFLRANRISGWTLEKDDVFVEISKTSSEDELYLIKLFLITENVLEGEKKLSKVCQDLETQVELIKPNPVWFYGNN